MLNPTSFIVCFYGFEFYFPKKTISNNIVRLIHGQLLVDNLVHRLWFPFNDVIREHIRLRMKFLVFVLDDKAMSCEAVTNSYVNR